MTRSERRWLLVWMAVALLLANTPYLLGWALSTPETRFGGAVYNVEDVNSYIAKMRQGAQGAWLFHIPYTAEEHPGTIVYLFYLLLGKLAPLTGLSLEIVYHLARLACGALLMVVAYAFLAHWTPYRAVRRTAFLLLAFSGGLGWLLTMLGRPSWLGSLPIDMILPEGYLFLTLYSPPHLALATAGMLWGMLRVHEAGTHPSRRAAATLAGTTAWTLSALIGAFYTLIPLAVLGVDWLVTALRRRRPDWSALAHLALAALAPALIAGYTLCVFACDPIYRAWSVQNQIGSPHPLHYLAGYALVGALALLGAGRALRRRQAHLQLPLVWVALTPLLVYLPFSMQRRLINGAQVPLCLLAAQGLIYGLILPFGRSAFVRCLSRHPRYSRAGMRRWAIATVVLLTMPTNLLLILGNCLQTSMRAPPIYHSRAELEALDWLRENTAPGDTVLCAYETGNYVPARAGNRVLLGLGTETAYAARKRVEVQRFFDERESDAWRQELLRRYHIAYVLVGPRERTLGGATPFAADGAPYLEAVQSTGTSGDDHYTLYRVKVGP